MAIEQAQTLSASADETIPEGEKPLVEEPEDVDPDELLAEISQRQRGTFALPSGKHIKLISITEQELDRLTDRSKKPDKTNPNKPPRVDMLMLRRNIVAYSISMAAGTVGTPNEKIGQHLLSAPPGTITEMQREVFRLSGFVDREPVAPDPMALFG